jgi:hypothetical protein
MRIRPLRSRAPRVAFVLGCGPAGLFAATGLRDAGYRVRILSKPRKSELFGTQYLHAPVPGLTDAIEPVSVRYELRGTAEGYRDKVYGAATDLAVSPESLETDHQAWDIRRAYDNAWREWEPFIEAYPSIDPLMVKSIWAENMRSPIVSSIPATDICYLPDEHRFQLTQVWAAGDAPERGRYCPIDVAADEQVICDGTRDVGWYRHSKVFGYRSVEWPMRGEKRPPIAGLTLIEKPTITNCDCFGQTVTRVGRYGEWTKGVLSHTAYEKAVRL